jgi:hypothetical protein
MNRTKLAQQCGGLPADLTIELISPSAKSYIRHPWRILVAIHSVDPPALHQARPSEGQSLSIGLTAKRPPDGSIGKNRRSFQAALGKFGADTE